MGKTFSCLELSFPIYEAWPKGQVLQGLEEDGNGSGWKKQRKGEVSLESRSPAGGNRQNHPSKPLAQETSPSTWDTWSKGTLFWTWWGWAYFGCFWNLTPEAYSY